MNTNEDSIVPHITRDDMFALRRRLRFTQQKMAEQMGLSKSAYVAIEHSTSDFRKIHALAAERVALQWAHHLDLATALPKSVFHDLDHTLRRWSVNDLRKAQIALAEAKAG